MIEKKDVIFHGSLWFFSCPIRFAVSANEFICLGPIQHTFRIVCGLHCFLFSSSGPALPLKLHLFLQYLILSSWSCFRQTFQMTKSSFCLAYLWFCLANFQFLGDYFPVLVWQNHNVCLTKSFLLDIWMTKSIQNPKKTGWWFGTFFYFSTYWE